VTSKDIQITNSAELPIDETQQCRESTPYDELLKHLVDRYPKELLSYLGELNDIESCESVGGEVEIIHRITDRVFRVTRGVEQKQEQFLVHLEFESSYNAQIGKRLGAYGWGLYQKEKLPVQHIVWYVSEDKPSYWPDKAWYRYQTETMTIKAQDESWVRWREVWLPGPHNARDFIKTAPPYLWPFAALMRGTDRAFVGQLTEAINNCTLPETARQDLLVMVVYFFARSFGLNSVMEIVKMSGLERNPLIDYFIQKGLEKGREEGLEKGLEKGREKGREEGLEKGREEGLEKGREEGLEKGREEGLRQAQMQIAIRLATQRFGPLSLSVLSQMQTLPRMKLETLVESLLDSKLHDLDSFIQALSS
jgi:hypothetical protein